MIFAAGLGTRMKPYTEHCPKALVEVEGKPLLELVIQKLKVFGFNELIINVHHFAEQVEEFLSKKHNFGISISLSDERETLLETGGGLKKAAWFFDDNKPFLVHNVDILSTINLSDVFNYHLKAGALATLVCQKREGSRFFLFDNDLRLCGWTNKATNELKLSRAISGETNYLGFSGIHVINPKIFDLITETGRFSIVEVYLRLANQQFINAYIDLDSQWFDVGTPNKVEEVAKLIQNKF